MPQRASRRYRLPPTFPFPSGRDRLQKRAGPCLFLCPLLPFRLSCSTFYPPCSGFPTHPFRLAHPGPLAFDGLQRKPFPALPAPFDHPPRSFPPGLAPPPLTLREKSV